MNFIKLIQKIKDNKKNITIFFMFFVVFYLFSDVTFAASTDFGELKNKTAEFAEFLLKGISLLLALITYLATIFLSPTWINGSLFGLNTYFKEIWILMSNVVYFIFAFILIWIAFMNIIGRNGEMYQLKQALPKFIVGVIIVPFSWFLVQFVLSISAVLTISALSLPFDKFDTFSSSLSSVEVPVNCELNLNSFSGNGKSENSENKDDGFISCDEKSKIPITDIAGKGDAISSIFGIISMYTYGILSLDTIDEVDKIDIKNVKTMGDLILKIVFDLLFVVVYSVLMIALGLVLMVRGIYIWIYMMMSPVFGLMYFFGKDKGGDGFFGKFNLKEFIALAMVPVYTMLALSFGLLFLYVVGSGISGSSKVSTDEEVSLKDDIIKVGQFNLKIVGQVSKEQNITGFGEIIGNAGLGIVGSLILKVFGIVVLWGAIMAAMRTSEITKQITQPIYDFGSQVGKIMSSATGNIPIFPTGKGGMQSMNSLNTAIGDISSHISTKQNTKGRELSSKFLPGGEMENKYGAISDKTPTNKDDALNNISNIRNSGTFKEMADSTNANKGLVKNLEKLNSEGIFNDNKEAEELIKQIKNSNGNENQIKDAMIKLNNMTTSNSNKILGGTYSQGDFNNAFGSSSKGANSSSVPTPTSTPTSGTGTTQPINIRINNNNIENFNGMDSLSPDKQAAIKGLKIDSFTKDKFIEELNKPNVLGNEQKAREIADSIPSTIFKQEPTN